MNITRKIIKNIARLLIGFSFVLSINVYAQDQPVIPPGTIIAFGGTVAPTGWQLCDGTNGSPDLRGKFIRGANPSGANGAPVANVGATQDDLTVAHNHSVGTLNFTTSANGSHYHSHGHTATLTSAGNNHIHSVSSTSGSAGGHTHGLNTTGSHNHSAYRQHRYHSMVTIVGGGLVNVWRGDYTGGTGLPSGYNPIPTPGNHTHTINSSNYSHTHTFSGNALTNGEITGIR